MSKRRVLTMTRTGYQRYVNIGHGLICNGCKERIGVGDKYTHNGRYRGVNTVLYHARCYDRLFKEVLF